MSRLQSLLEAAQARWQAAYDDRFAHCETPADLDWRIAALEEHPALLECVASIAAAMQPGRPTSEMLNNAPGEVLAALAELEARLGGGQ